MVGVSLKGVDLKNSKSFKEGTEYLRVILALVLMALLTIIATPLVLRDLLLK